MTTKVNASFPPMIKAMIMANRNITGALTAVLIVIIYAFCTLVISVVVLVTRDEVENLSMLENEKSWILAKTSALRFLANPAEALAQNVPANTPQRRDTSAAATMVRPTLTRYPRSTPPLIRLTRSAVINGISTSRNTSPRMKIRVSTVGFLFSLNDLKIVLTGPITEVIITRCLCHASNNN